VLRLLVAVLLLAIGLPIVVGLGIKLRQLKRLADRGIIQLRSRSVSARASARLDARTLLAELPVIGGLSFAEREEIVNRLRLRRIRVGEYGIREGAVGHTGYLVRSGEADVMRLGSDGWPHRLTTVRRGDYFGELALIYDQTRQASVRARDSLEVYALERTDFDALIRPHLSEFDRDLFAKRARQRAELTQMELFRNLATRELDHVLDRFAPEEYQPSEVVIREGDPGERFYVVRRGRLLALRDHGQGREPVLGLLGPGDFFGEMALLADSPRSATVKAIEPVLLWSLDRAGLKGLLLDRLQLQGLLQATAGRRHAVQCRLGDATES
jgi:CRP-like cAMP-binding protein